MDRKRSKLWQFFTEATPDKAKCDLCHTLYSVKGGSTTNLKKHMIKKHRPSYEAIVPLTSETFEAPQPENSQPALPPSTSEPHLPSSSSSSSQNIVKSLPQQKQTVLSTFIKRPVSVVREKNINDLVFKMIIKDLQPFSLVEDEGFKSLINYLEPGYSLPSRYMLSNTLLDAHYLDVKNKIRDELKSASYITITTDGWTSRTTTSYQAVTAHYFVDWQFKFSLLGCFECEERHTAEYIRDKLTNLLKDWEINEKVVMVVTDNAANMKAAIRLLRIDHFHCIAHTLNLVVRAGLQVFEVENILKKIKIIVEHFHRSPVATKKLISMQEQLKPNQKPLKLKMDVVTRWNSTLDMMERVLLLQEPLEAALGLLHNPVETLLEDDWKALPEIIKILRPFKEITIEMSSQTEVTISKVLAATDGLQRLYDNFYFDLTTDISKNLLLKIKTEFNNRFKNCSRHPVLAKAALLDPRFKRLAFRDEGSYENAKTMLRAELENLTRTPLETEVITEPSPAIPDNDSIWKEFDAKVLASGSTSNAVSSIITMRQYMEEKILSRNECPLKWWQARTVLYPELSSLAQKYLSIMATSVPSERTFSKSGQILSERRSSLKPKRMEKILFLNMNQKFI